MAGNLKERIKNTRLYREMQEIQKEYYRVLSPISEALFGDLGKKNFAEKEFPFGFKLKEDHFEDVERDGVTYGIAALLAAGMSIDDIFDPEKFKNEKRVLGKEYLKHVRNDDRKAIMEIYIKATERIMNEVPLVTKDNLVDNLRDVKAEMLRKVIFTTNQRFGRPENKEAFESYFKEHYKDPDEAKVQQEKIYNYVDYIQTLHHSEVILYSVIIESTSVDPVLGHITNFESWKRSKERIKNIRKDTSKEELEDIRDKRVELDVEAVGAFMRYTDDLEDFIIQEFDKENPLENPFEDAFTFMREKFIGGRSPEANAKFYFEGPVKDAVGDLNLDDALNTGIHRILINGKPLEFPQNASNAFVEQSLYNQLAEAAVAGKKITYFTPNAETGELEQKEMKVRIPVIVKEEFKAKLPKTSISTDAKMKRNDLAEAEAAHLQHLNAAEALYYNQELRTLMDIRYNYNQAANEIGKSIFGENSGRDVRYGETLNFMSTGLADQGDINLAESGVAYAAAMLLAEGMSMEDILDISKDTEKKLEAGQRVQELAAKGDDGHKELSALAEQAMKIIHEGKYSAMSADMRENGAMSADMRENTANFRANFAAQIMHVLKQETNDKELQSYAESYEIINLLGQKPDASKVGSINEWASEYLASAFLTQTFRELSKDDAYKLTSFDGKAELLQNSSAIRTSSYNKMAEALGLQAHDIMQSAGIYENTGLNADLEFQKVCFETLYQNLQAVDPGYIVSSAEFKGMKKSIQDILELYNNANEAGSKDWYYRLEETCNALSAFNEKYLERKDGLEMKEGSNAQKRLDFAKSAKQMIAGAQTLAHDTGKIFSTIDFQAIRNKMAKTKYDIEQNLELYENIVGPTHEAPSAADKETDQFLKTCFELKKEENNYKAPDKLHITDKQAGLIVMMSVGTLEVSGDSTKAHVEMSPDGRSYNTVNVLGEDIFNRRALFEKDKMEFVEKGRAVVKEAFDQYEKGNHNRLGKIIAEGMKRYTSAFAVCTHGFFGAPPSGVNTVANLKVAADMYDMIQNNDNIKRMISDESLGADRISQQTMETYRGAKMAYEIYIKAEEAKKDLMDMISSREKTPEQPQKMKSALAALVLKSIFHHEMKMNYTVKSDALGKYMAKKYPNGVEDADGRIIEELDKAHRKDLMELSQKMSMGKFQRGFTEEKMNQRLEALANSKTIDKMVKSMDANKLKTMFENEKRFFDSTIKTMMKNEPSAIMEKEPKSKPEPEKQNVSNELPFTM